jgi:regulator of sirC expression with transglutaminase-like and TPR domain
VSDAAEARRALGALVAGDESQIDLPRAALLIALEEYPGLDPQAYIDQLDQLGRTLRARMSRGAAPERQIAALNALLFGEEGFRGFAPQRSWLSGALPRGVRS